MTPLPSATQFDAVTRPDYRLRDVRTEAEGGEPDLSGYERLFARNATARRPGQLEWQQITNPSAASGAVLVADASDPDPSHEDGLGAIYAAMGVGFQIDGVAVPAAQSLDTLTDINHRKKGLFTDLAKSAYAAQQAAGVALVYGFPNGNSVHGFTRKLSWQLLDPVPFMVRPLRTGYLARRVSKALGWVNASVPVLGSAQIPGGTIAPLTTFGAEHDALWARTREGIGVSIDRTADYMTWRLQKRPGSEAYRMAALHVNGTLAGEIAWCVENKHGGRIGYVMELLHDPARSAHGTALMRHALRMMARDGVEVVLAWNDASAFNARAHRAAGFLPLPARLQPIELHWGVVALGSDAQSDTLANTLAARIYNRDAWYISYLDSDTV